MTPEAVASTGPGTDRDKSLHQCCLSWWW